VHDHGLSFNISTTGWKKECKCKTERTVPAIVFDPFFGSGTTGLVAYDLGRDYLGIELQKNYKDIQKERLGNRFNQLRLL
jgi:adenine specific DNA methylase Mod